MKDARTELIIDIGSASVGACLAVFKEGEKPTLTHVKRTSLQTDSRGGLDNIQALALEALKKTLSMLPDTPRPSAIRVVFAAPWYASEIKVIVSESPKPLKIGRATVTHALEKQRSEDAKKTRRGRHLLESVVNQIYVNGYPTALHKTVQGTVLKVNLYESEADSDFVEAIQKSLQSIFRHVPQHFHTFPFVAFAALRALREEDNFILIDIGGEITDVAIGDQGALRFMGSFPKGASSLVREITGGGSYADATSRLILFVRNELSPEETATFSKIFTNSANAWNQEYGFLMESAVVNTPIPRTTFLMADKDELQWFKKVFSMRGDTMPVQTIPITSNFLEAYLSLGESGAYDSFLSLEALFFKLNEESLMKI